MQNLNQFATYSAKGLNKKQIFSFVYDYMAQKINIKEDVYKQLIKKEKQEKI